MDLLVCYSHRGAEMNYASRWYRKCVNMKEVWRKNVERYVYGYEGDEDETIVIVVPGEVKDGED